MKKVVGLVLAMSMGSAFAHGCPDEMKAIDAKLPSVKLDQAQMTKVKELRAKGEQLHKDGKHTESMASLAEAKKLVGL
jgi:outer membrane murein-binding lipoprotein Lpp